MGVAGLPASVAAILLDGGGGPCNAGRREEIERSEKEKAKREAASTSYGMELSEFGPETSVRPSGRSSHGRDVSEPPTYRQSDTTTLSRYDTNVITTQPGVKITGSETSVPCDTRIANESDELAASVSATGRGASDVQTSIRPEERKELNLSADKPSLQKGSTPEEYEVVHLGSDLTHILAANRPPLRTTREDLESAMMRRQRIKKAWLEAQTTQSYNIPPTSRVGHAGISDSKLNLRGNSVMQFKPISLIRDFSDYGTQAAKPQTVEIDLKVKNIDDESELEGRFTSVSKQIDSSVPIGSAFVDIHVSPPTQSAEKVELNYDVDSELNYDDDKPRTYKEKIITISAKIVHPCIETIKLVTGNEPSSTGEGSSTDSSSSAKTSVIVTEETDVSDDNATSVYTDSEKNVTARRISTGTTTVCESDFEKVDSTEKVFKPRGGLKPESKRYATVKRTSRDRKLISEECSEKHTSEDNSSRLEDDDINASTTVKKGHDYSRECSQRSSSSSEEALPSLEEKNHKAVNQRPNKTERRKRGLTSSEKSITPLAKSKSESETDTKESWLNFKSESSTASKNGLTSSDEGKSDDSKKKTYKTSSERESDAIHISNRDRIQNLISDRKTVISRMTPAEFEMLDQAERGILAIKRPIPSEVSESEESGISGDTDSSSMEVERISERLLPIGGSITLIKGKPPSDRSSPSWGSVSSLLGLTWEKHGTDEPSDRSWTSSLSTLHRETPVPEVTPTRKHSPQQVFSDKPSSESDTSSEETRRYKKIPCETIIKQMQLTDEEIVMTAHYCIDSITFGIRRSLSDETLFSIEAYTQAQDRKTSDSVTLSSVLPERACDACTFLLLLQTLIIRERVSGPAFRRFEACLVHNIGLGKNNVNIFRYLLKKMPLCEFCTFPSVEQMILILVKSKHGVLMHRSENLPPIYVIFPPYAEGNRAIGRVVHLRKRKMSDYAEKARIRVMMAERYIIFPKLQDVSIWGKTMPKRENSVKRGKTKSRPVSAKMDDIPELNEPSTEEFKIKGAHGNSLKVGIKKWPSKRKHRKCILQKWSVQKPCTASHSQLPRTDPLYAHDMHPPNVIIVPSPMSLVYHRHMIPVISEKRRRCILKKWQVRLSPSYKRKNTHKHKDHSEPGTSKSKDKSAFIKQEAKASTSQVVEHNMQIDGVVLVRKKRPWWKCPKKQNLATEAKKKSPPAKPKRSAEFFLHPTYQQPLLSYASKSQQTGEDETRTMSSRQDLLAQRLAYHYIRELTEGRAESTTREDPIKVIKPALTDFQSREYEKRRTFIRGQSVPRTDEPSVSQDSEDQYYEDYDSPEESSNPKSPLDLAKYNLSEIDYHFETCPIIQSGHTPYKPFLKLQQVYKTSNFEDSWLEYHVEDCSYFMIDGTNVIDLKVVHLVLAEKTDDTCDCAEKLIKGGNIYLRDKTSQTFHHDLCLLFPRQLESGDIDLQSLFNPNIPSREFDANDVIRFYFISKRSDTKDARILDYREVPITKLKEIQESIKTKFSTISSQVESGQVYSDHDSPSEEESYQAQYVDENLRAAGPSFEDMVEAQRFLSPLRVDSESEDSMTVYSLENCMIYASEHMTADSMSSPQIDSVAAGEIQILNKQAWGHPAESQSRQFTPSPKPADQSRHDNNLSPRPVVSDDDQIYYRLGEFSSQIPKTHSPDQRVSPRPLEIHDDSSGIYQFVQLPGLLSPSTSSSDQMQGAMSQRSSPRLGVQDSDLKYIGEPLPLPPRQLQDCLKLGHSLDSFQRRRIRPRQYFTEDTQSLNLQPQDMRDPVPSPIANDPWIKREVPSDSTVRLRQISQRIRSHENVTRDCSCHLYLPEICMHMLALEEKFKQAFCAHHGAVYEEQLSKQRRALSQGDLRKKKTSISFDQGYTQSGTSPRSMETNRRQSSYPPFQRTRTYPFPLSSNLLSPDVQRYSIDPDRSPRMQDNLSQGESPAGSSVKQSPVSSPRALSHSGLGKRSLSFYQESREERDVSPRHLGEQFCLKGVYIPGNQRRGENVPQKQSELFPQQSRPESTSPRLVEGGRQRLHSADLTQSKRTDQRAGRSRTKSAEDKNSSNTWDAWREGSSPI